MPATNYNEYMREYMLKRYYECKKQAYEYLGNKCAECGTTKKPLEIDHINYKEKSFAISRLWSVSEKKFWLEIDKCQLLCNPCHKDKNSSENKDRRPITHGKYHAAYHLKCSCLKCIAFKKKYARERREKRKGACPSG